ncbi:MAG: hypothetical protein HYV96_14745 [Opitutae bacterium]|nr:hypothetical protein [Opitutae bacterium]
MLLPAAHDVNRRRRSLSLAAFCAIALTCSAAADRPAESSAVGLDDSAAIEPARRLHAFLYELSRSEARSNKLIAGHWLGASFRDGKAYPFNLQEPLEIRRHTGKWIGMIDGWICPGEFPEGGSRDPIADCMWYDEMIADYTLWWRNGGIVHVAASFFAPLADRYGQRLDPDAKVDLDAVLRPGTPDNQRWRAMLDRMATFFQALEAREVPVIFRPFTEGYLAHFWYSRQRLGDEGAKRLWIDLHDYLTGVKGCHNIVWDFQGGKAAPHYPGDAYVDLYTAKSEYRTWKVAPFQTLEPDDLPMGNAELGDYGASARADAKGKSRIAWNDWVEAIREKAPRLAFFTSWDREWGAVKRAGADGRYRDYDSGYDAMIANPYVLTRDELIGFSRPPAAPALPERDAWIPVNGKWKVDGARIVRTDREGEGRIIAGNTDWTDYSVQATLRADTAGEVGVLGRCASSDIYYLLAIKPSGLTLSRRFNRRLETLATWSHAFEPGRHYNVKLIMRGDRIEGHVDTGDGLMPRVSTVDDFIPCGAIGFRAVGAGTEITNIQVETVEAAR